MQRKSKVPKEEGEVPTLTGYQVPAQTHQNGKFSSLTKNNKIIFIHLY